MVALAVQAVSAIERMKRTERGFAGHFIGSRSCNFRRNTLLESGDKRIVVSTVGNYRPNCDRRGREDAVEEIGHQRYYETMAFHAKWIGSYWEANVTQEIDAEIDVPWAISVWEEHSDRDADLMHEAYVAAVASWMKAQP